MNETPLTLILEIATDPDGDHLAGHLAGPTGARRAFVGRIGLMCAIDAFVAEDAPPAPPTTATRKEIP